MFKIISLNILTKIGQFEIKIRNFNSNYKIKILKLKIIEILKNFFFFLN